MKLVKIIALDGHKDWNVSSVDTTEMPAFDVKHCILALTDGECSSESEFGVAAVESGGVITINGEEDGHVFVLMN